MFLYLYYTRFRRKIQLFFNFFCVSVEKYYSAYVVISQEENKNSEIKIRGPSNVKLNSTRNIRSVEFTFSQ